jgi:hypothetical protein
MNRKIATATSGLVMLGAFLAITPGEASAAPPGNCDTTVDFGVWDSRHDSSYVGGTWYNCGTTWDYVYIIVNNASDSNCVWVGAQTSLHLSYNPLFWGPGSHTRTWGRC